MFDVPDAKRVRREDLHESASDEESAGDDQLDATLRRKLNAQLSGLLDLSFETDQENKLQNPPLSQIGDANRNVTDDGVDDDEGVKATGEEAFIFRLFRNEDPSHKVVLESQDASTQKNGEGAFVVAKRPLPYYLAGEPSPGIANKFKAAAVSADYIFQDANKRRWGLEKPWKVTTITITTNQKSTISSGHASQDASSGTRKQKKRPGKKRRIILRVREKAKKEQEESLKKQVVDKEQHLKEKKQRLNRLRKLKRRAQAREKKQGMKGDEASQQSSRDNSANPE
ncbi:hypothetical protein F5B19DRAFT_434340 [Rostrohypoxylon terebratum]|nr:hypothetical protein F5B19DRAFT_434340 [Rostrohypoxylon terebratum]